MDKLDGIDLDNLSNMKAISFKPGVNQFSPSSAGKIFNIWLPLLMMFISMIALYLGLISLVISVLLGETPISGEVFVKIIALGYFSWKLPAFFIVGINSFPTIRVVDKGLMVRVLRNWFTWEFISWNDIIEIIPSPLVLYGGDHNWIIKVKNKLTKTHTIIGKRFGDGQGPSILLNKFIINRYRLIEKSRFRL